MPFSLYLDGKKIDPGTELGDPEPEDINLFESLRTYGRVIFREDEHLARLAESARTTGLRLPKTLDAIRSDLREAIRLFDAELAAAGEKDDGDLFLRVTVWREKIFILVGARRHPKNLYEDGIVLETTPVRRSLTNAAAPQAKTGAYQNGVLAALQPSPGAYEHLFLDPEGYVAEVSIGNIFIVKKDGTRGKSALFTPPARGILNGVTRRFVIECAAQAGIKVYEIPFSRHDVYNADEAFLTNTSWEVLPARELDRRSIGKQVPGPLTSKIHRLFRERALRECRRSRSAAR